MARNKKKKLLTDDGQKPKRSDLLNTLISRPVGDNIEKMIKGKANRMPRLATPQMHGTYDKNFSSVENMSSKFGHATLRKVADNSGLLKAIVSRRDFQVFQIAKRWKFEGDVGFRVVHDQHHELNFNTPNQLNDMARGLEKMIEQPWGYLEPTFAGFASKFMKDLVIINRPAIEIGLGSKGQPVAFGMIDGANVYPTFDVLKALIPNMTGMVKIGDKKQLEPNTPAYDFGRQLVSDKYELDISSKTEWLYMQDQVPQAAYTLDEMILMPIMPTTAVRQYGHPPSMAENSIRLVLAEMLAMSYNMNYFQHGAMIDTMIGVVGSYDDEHIQEFIETLKMNHTGVDGAHRIPVMPVRNPEDIHIYNLRQNNRDMVYSEFMNLVTSLTCACFGMPPEEINIKQNTPGGRHQFEGNNQKQIQQNKEEGLFAIRNHMKTCMDMMIKRINPNLCFEWFGLSGDMDRLRKETSQKELAAGGITTREYRLMNGMEPVPQGMTDEDVDIFHDQAWVTLQQSKVAQEQAEQQAGAEQQQDDDATPYDFKEAGDEDYPEPDFDSIDKKEK